GRLLDLPDELEAEQVQCPLCRTAFDPRPAVVRPPRPVSSAPAGPLRPKGAVEVPVPGGGTSRPVLRDGPTEEDPELLRPPQRSRPHQAVQSAAGWMQAAAVLAGLRALCCCAEADTGLFVLPVAAFWAAVIFRFAPALLFLFGAQ